MFEVIISSVSTGRVRRKWFDSREEADRYVDGIVYGWKSRGPHYFRVEIYHRPLPSVRTLPVTTRKAPAA